MMIVIQKTFLVGDNFCKFTKGCVIMIYNIVTQPLLEGKAQFREGV